MSRDTRRMRHFLPWPERHGFSVGGFGPSYVLSITKGSAADKQGLKVGDQIIELDNHKVKKMAAPALESFAKHMNNRMPTIKVVNEVQHVELYAMRLHRYGLTLKYSQRNGFLIDAILPRGPAYRAGLRVGDLVLEINGKAIYDRIDSIAMTQKLLSAHRGKATLAVLPCGKHIPSRNTSRQTQQSRQLSKATKDLYAKMNSLFTENYEKKLALIGVLKSYAESRNVEKLAKSLVLILPTPGQRKILPYIRLHIPMRDRTVFDGIVQRSVGKSYAEDRLTNQPAAHVHQDYPQRSADPPSSGAQLTAHSQSSLLHLRSAYVHKGDNDLGVLLRGQYPVVIETVVENSAAHRAGVLKGDCILRINEQSVMHSSHRDIQQLVQHAGPTVHLELIQQVHMSGHRPELQFANGSLPYESSQPMTSPRSRLSSPESYDLAAYNTSISRCSCASHHRFDLNCSKCGLSSSQSHALPDARVDGDYDSSTISSRHSERSSAEWAFQHSLRPQDRGPASFKTQVNYLLDRREKKLLKQYLFDYSSEKNIELFVQRTSALLDTPAKRTLWSFVLPLLSSSHKEYTLERVQLPDTVIGTGQEQATSSNGQYSSTELITSVVDGAPPDTMTSFKIQLDFLLTSPERRAVKRALQHYKESKDIQALVETLTAILDTKSKRSLWIHILALLPASHQHYARCKVNLPSSFLRGQRRDSTTADYTDAPRSSAVGQHRHYGNGKTRRNRILSQSEDEFFVVSPRAHIPDDEGTENGDDVSNIAMLSYAPRGSYAQRDREQRLPGADHFMENPLYGKHDPLSLSREADYPQNGIIADAGIYAYDAITMPNDKTGSYKRGKPNTAFVARTDWVDGAENGDYHSHNGVSRSSGDGHSGDGPSKSKHGHTESRQGHSESRVVHSGSRVGHSESRVGHSGSRVGHSGSIQNGADVGYLNGYAADDLEATGSSVNSFVLHDSQGSDTSYKRQVKQALQTMDAAVEGYSGGETHRSSLEQPVSLYIPPPPPLPPSLLPPGNVPPPPPADSSAPILVKRLNWETHNPDQIDQTVWGQWKSSEQLDIEGMVEYLELPQQFSTAKRKAPTAKVDKKVVKKTILHQKKAFNTSIILASLAVPGATSREQRITCVEHALLRVEVDADSDEEGVITPHLLQQLLQYAPDKDEVQNYLTYNGELGELSDVDRFCYRMVRIPGYEDRLQSMLFKATFDEKCTEVEQSLELVKTASEQIRQSRGFAKILELVLAMGNQLDKATNKNKPPAAAFKVSSLSQLDSTKTMDHKKSFLDVLVQAVHEKFPHLLSTSSELSQVPLAERVTFPDVSKEIAELQHVLQQISATKNHLTAEAKHYTVEDRFEEVMEHFVGAAEDRLQHLVRLQADTNQQYSSMLAYLGEKHDGRGIFSTISHFLAKFDNSHRLYVQKIEADLLSPRSPTSDAAQFISAL